MLNIRYFILIIFLKFSIISFCQQEDNYELKKMYSDDQNSRKIEKIDWKLLVKEDSIRRHRVSEIIELNQLVTGRDYYRAAIIFQHGKDSLDYRVAIELIRNALKLDTTISPWLLAAAIDRELMSRKKPQVYGTQYFLNNDESWELYNIDTTVITDKERMEYRVPSLSTTRENIRLKNLKKIDYFFTNSKSLKLTLKLIKSEFKKGKNSIYNVSESSINSLGYRLLNLGNTKGAFKLFKLNATLYPLAFNTYDSLGECLLLLHKKRKGLAAYEKSLELNPNNDYAREIIRKIKDQN